MNDLSRFRYHTGAPLRPPAPGEPYPVLFRDLGTVALARYLRGELTRLAGPMTPLLYMRTLDYREPYVDHEDIGRIVFLRPDGIAPWHAGIPHVYVAAAGSAVPADAVGFAQPGTPLAEVARLAVGVRDSRELREALGGRGHDAACADALARLDDLNLELVRMEVFAGPLRTAFQARDPARRAAAREELRRLGITETDLCAAWHHLPRERRAELREILPRIDLARLGGSR